METVGHSEASEKMAEVHGSGCGEHESNRLGRQAFEQGLELLRKWHDEWPVTLADETDSAIDKINAFHRDGCLAQTAPCVITDEKCTSHPFGLGLQSGPNHWQMLAGYLGLFLLVLPLELHAIQGIAGRESNADGMTHEHSQKLDFFQGGIFAGRPNAATTFNCAIGSPEHVIPAVLGRQLVGELDAVLDQEREHRAPAVGVRLQVQRLGGVTLGDEFGNPLAELHPVNANQLFLASGLSQQVVREPGLRGIIPPEFGGLGWPARFSAEADPPKRRTIAPIQIRHKKNGGECKQVSVTRQQQSRTCGNSCAFVAVGGVKSGTPRAHGYRKTAKHLTNSAECQQECRSDIVAIVLLVRGCA